MAQKIKYLHSYVDPTGVKRTYVRFKGLQLAIPNYDGSPTWHAAYAEALSRLKAGEKPSREYDGSIQSLCELFFASADFRSNAESTQKGQRCILQGFCTQYGHLPAAQLTRKWLLGWRDRMVSAQGVFNARLKLLRQLFDFAIDRELLESNPTDRVKLFEIDSEGYIPWSSADIATFRQFWAKGTMQRLALELLLFTAARGCDVYLLGEKDIAEGCLRFRAKKNGEWVDLPLEPELEEVIEATAVPGAPTFILNWHGKTLKDRVFTSWFSKAARAAGLSGRTAHGLRKARATELSEAGATENEVMAFIGDRSPQMAALYTKSSNRKRLAANAMSKARAARATAEVIQTA